MTPAQRKAQSEFSRRLRDEDAYDTQFRLAEERRL